jgi:signal transduction histidine kinase
MVHHLSKGLSPVEMQNCGLVHALRELARSTENMFSISCTIFSDSTLHMSNEVATTHLYRIAREAITNAVKHGGADTIDILLARENKKIILSITDNGSGIPDKSERKGGMGLRIMNYRARIIGAIIDIFRRDEAGTVVSCIIPQEEIVGSEP